MKLFDSETEWYGFLIHGENYLLKIDNGVEIMGFYTTRYFKTDSQEKAEKLAVENIKNDGKLNAALVQTHALTPTFCIEEVYAIKGRPPRVGIFSPKKTAGGGFTFYNMTKEK